MSLTSYVYKNIERKKVNEKTVFVKRYVDTTERLVIKDYQHSKTVHLHSIKWTGKRVITYKFIKWQVKLYKIYWKFFSLLSWWVDEDLMSYRLGKTPSLWLKEMRSKRSLWRLIKYSCVSTFSIYSRSTNNCIMSVYFVIGFFSELTSTPLLWNL